MSWTPAVIVIASRKASGPAVIQAYRPRPVRTRIVVAIASAVPARSWFDSPNRGHSARIPPYGSSTPPTRKYPQSPTNAVLVSTVGPHPDPARRGEARASAS